MAIDFPSTPFIGQQISQGGTTWQWDGTGWNIVPVMASAFASDTPPANPTDGQQWWRSTNGQLYFYYNDGNSKQWVQAAGAVYDDGYTKKTAQAKNIVVNGAMTVSQELGLAAASITGSYPADQWLMGIVGPVCSIQLVTVPTPANSPYRIRKTVTTQKPSLAAGDYSTIMQPIEGVRLAGLAFGSAAAVQLVLRFGFKGPAGTYSFSLRNGVVNRTYIKNFTISAGQANTDTLQTFVIPGDIAGTWVVDSTVGAYLSVTDAIGTTAQGVEGWQAGNFTGTAANSNMGAVNGNLVELFDVGLYADPDKTGVAPPYEVVSFDKELPVCQRYYCLLDRAGFAGACHAAGLQHEQRQFFITSMRTVPVCAMLGGTIFNIASPGLNRTSVSSVGLSWVNTNIGAFYGLDYTIVANARM